MADMGELALAHEYRKQLNLPQSVLTVDPAAVAAQEAARRQQYMQLELPPAALLFVNDEETLQQAAQMLAGSDVIGLDVEWKASHEAGEAFPAAVLQVRLCRPRGVQRTWICQQQTSTCAPARRASNRCCCCMRRCGWHVLALAQALAVWQSLRTLLAQGMWLL
eukprot:GHRQ01025193.1.p2 GENE.GHRQ01025193.1~~GHRQ01025193.1.p2  ORF type:complete len:164 (+),score=56.67 GHRQ01025193.1:741-1232(+)